MSELWFATTLWRGPPPDRDALQRVSVDLATALAVITALAVENNLVAGLLSATLLVRSFRPAA